MIFSCVDLNALRSMFSCSSEFRYESTDDCWVVARRREVFHVFDLVQVLMCDEPPHDGTSELAGVLFSPGRESTVVRLLNASAMLRISSF